MKTIIFIFIISLSLHADYLLGNLECCASDYYYSYDTSANKYKLYYINSRTGQLNKTTANVGFISSGYSYDSDTDKCTLTNHLGLSSEQYNFLYSLFGLFLGFSLFWLVPKK